MAKRIIIFALLSVYVATVASGDDLPKTLHMYDDSSSKQKRTVVINADDNLSSHDRQRRDVSSNDSQNTKSNITVKYNILKDSHKQLMVHWVGEQTDIIVCLAKDPSPRLPGVHITPSAIYISYNYGDTFENKTDQFKLNNTTYASVDKFYNHHKYNTHFVFTDTKNKLIFTTTNHGKNITKIPVDFEPSDISFHDFEADIFVVLDKNDPEKKLWLTDDFGASFKIIQQYVSSFFWFLTTPLEKDLRLYVQRDEPSGLTTILVSDSLFLGHPQHKVFSEEVKNFIVKGDLIFVTKKSTRNNLDLYISHKGGPLVRCIFDTELDRREYHIADVTGTRVMVAVSHTDKLSHLYVSEGIGILDPIRFTLSLEGVFCYFPNSTWKDSWLNHVSDEAFADVYKVEGLTGIYIASQVLTRTISSLIGPQHLVSVITYDHGGTWQLLQPPKFDNEGQPISCTAEQNCSLHLSQKFSQLYPDTRTPSIMSSKSAPGIIMATGVVGRSLKGHFGVYISTDAGITWREGLKDFCFFNMGDHGGVLIAVKYYKNQGETRQIMYSTDEGEKWTMQDFHNEGLRLYGLMTEPGENTTVFTMFGSAPGDHQWIIIKLDMRNIFSYNCKPDDYKSWSPSQSDGHRLVPCILGKQETYERRIAHTNCYNGQDYVRPITLLPCVCDTEDYECDFGFMRSVRQSHCIRNKSLSYDPYAIPKSCKPGQFYNRTKGYRKIDGDICNNGFSYLYEPDSLPCPFKETEDFLIVAQREKIDRVNLVTNKLEVIPVHNLKNVIAIDFDMKNNCLYWADIVTDTIGRQCFNNGTNFPEILVESNLASIEGMAFDWISNVLYFVDGMRAKIEIIRTDISHMGRMRRTILGPEVLKKPRGIAVHPMSGYIFWTDWAPEGPSVNRANMDGTNIKKLFTKPVVEWPNGVSIDHIAERIYWVDAREDYIASSDLEGKRFKKILMNDDSVSHPFAVAVFKDTMYWDDWKRNGIFSADKDHPDYIRPIQENLPGLMDLKVFAHSIQEGINGCSDKNKSSCEFICLGAPGEKHVCLCPDGMNMMNGKCLCPQNVPPHANMTCPQVGHTCAPEHFACSNSLCIPKLWRCDGENDCGDNSDEVNCKPVSCGPNLSACGDGKCIPKFWRCDYEFDCVDKTDELDCKVEKCKDIQFSCQNGKCVPNSWQCDGQNDCGDNSDEKDCMTSQPTGCKINEFQCATGNKHCIPYFWQCDGEIDCQDRSDESNCEKKNCSDFQFMCADKQCIYKSWVCDGDYDCRDHSDENNCTTTTPLPVTTDSPFIHTNSCHDWMFMCANQKCIPYWWKCDNVYDCSDGSDEFGCGDKVLTTTKAPMKTSTVSPPCNDNQFQCFNGACILEAWVCDGSKDCPLGEDESHCEGKKNCTSKQFKCKIDGSCIPQSSVCDKKYDCPDGSDEFCKDSHPHESGSITCSDGFFLCDQTRCFPLASYCDGKQHCFDGFDENDCNTTERVYQVLQMGVDERGINSTSLLLYWWIPIPQNIKFEFMPSISKVKTNGHTTWKNHSSWIEHSEFRFSGLDAYTEYNMTVYVRVKEQNKVSPPAKYFTATTGEGYPSEPLNLTVQQKNGSHVLLKWEPPAQTNGEIVAYGIHWAPPIPPHKETTSSNSTTYLLSADYQPDVEYSFWIIAHNHMYESKSSKLSILKFDGDSNIDIIKDLKVVTRTSDSVSLTWRAVKGAEAYNVTPEVRTPYPQLDTITVMKNYITIKNLSPGTSYTFKVKAIKKTYVGHENVVITYTDGVKLPEVLNLNVAPIKEIGTTVRLKWDAPKDPRKIKWEYGIYYALNAQDLFKQTPKTTYNETTIIEDLAACEEYIFSVGIVGPLGKGPLFRNPQIVMTHMNPRAAPKRVTVQQDSLDETKMIVQWAASCPALKTNIGYLIRIEDLVLNKVINSGMNETSDSELSRTFLVNMGGKYKVTVSTLVKDAIPSTPVIYNAPSILAPHSFSVIPENNGSIIIYWMENELPERLKNNTKYKYVVLMSEGNTLNESIAQRFIVDTPPLILNNISDGSIYTFAVYLQTEHGYHSLMSNSKSILVESGSLKELLTSTSVVGVLMPLILIVLVLMAVLAFFVVRHRRLQQSFVRFANSHYDTRSGATTFGGDTLGDDDGPNIRGFSDDEPLVIA